LLRFGEEDAGLGSARLGQRELEVRVRVSELERHGAGAAPRAARPSLTSATIISTRRASRVSPSSRVASAGAPVYARSRPIARKVVLPALIPSERLVAIAGNAVLCVTRPPAASTSDVSYRP